MSSPIVSVEQILLNAYRLANVVKRPLTGLSNSEQEEGVDVLNAMIDAWQAETIFIWCRTRLVFPINANQGEYTIGTDVSTGIPDIITPRPEKIDRASYIFTNTAPPQIEQPFDILIEQQWAALSPKGLTSTIATKLYYLASVPLGKIFIWPIPTMSAQMALYLWTNLQQVSGASDVVDIPPGYRACIQSNLAIKLAMRYGIPPSPALVMEARADKARLAAINWEPLLSQCEAASLGVAGRDGYVGRYSILSNTYWGIS